MNPRSIMSRQRKSLFPPLLSLDAEREREKSVHDSDNKETAPESHPDRAVSVTRPVSKQRTGAAKADKTLSKKRDADLRKRKHFEVCYIAKLYTTVQSLDCKHFCPACGVFLLVSMHRSIYTLQKAEALVKTWDSLLVKEKEDKHAELLQRLDLQHKLITKNDVLSKQVEIQERERHAKVTCMYM